MPGFEANYGPFPNAQLQFQIPVAYERSDEDGRHHGLGDLQVGFKYRFIDEGDTWPQVAVYPQVQTPTGDAKAGLGSGHWRLYVPLLFQKSFGSWTTYGGPGWWRNPGAGNRDYSTFGWQIQRNFGEEHSIGLEVFYQGKDKAGGQGSTTLNLGFIRSLGPRFAAVASAGRVFKGEIGYQLYVGIRGSF